MSFSPQSRVWVYQSNRAFSNEEVKEIQQKLNDFTVQWKAHGHQLAAKAEVLYNFFIVFFVDEASAGVTGCSIDSSVRIIKDLEQTYNIDLFNRFNIAYKIDGKVIVTNKEDFETLVNIKAVGPKTTVFNNLVQTLQEFETKWEIPFEQSWHSKVFAHLL
ncbi:ABC transporter ATPase [Pedobacter psychroterrae]|uniref:ABC transporter ATPase n=1 Tax=Pedobacter psychroterrae TaxID=2530453 RepID=A0A4R0NUB2_9SPHI|nr:ABC transporter ATPase [Pedobacter psychroterrae]TCD03748.1 ABC transporter ATPase [Pedobacter psychroterrae]